MEAKRDSGLTAKQEKFAALLAQGCRQAAAYREAYDASGMKDDSVYPEASRLAHDPKIAARVRELLKEVRIEQIDDARQAFLDLLDALERATRAENWTAVASLSKMRFQFHGLLKDRLVLTDERQRSDDELAERLGEGDPERKALALKLMGKRSFSEK